MKMNCPKCAQAANPVYYSRSVLTLTGIVAGSGGMIGSIFSGARVGMRFGPVGLLAGCSSGAILAILFGASSGGLTGSQVGRLIDENIIGIWRCPHCSHRFRA